MNKERLIESYFLGILSEDEKIKFDELFETDTNFKKEIEFQKQVKNAVLNKEHITLKRHLQDIESNISNRQSLKTWWFAAAAILLFVSFGYYFFNKEYTNDSLFAEYYQPAKNIVHPIVRNETEENEETNAFIAYQQQDYKVAQQLFHSLFESTQKSEILFYEAISMLETDQIDLAIQKLEAHKQFNDAVSSRTNWYLALAYLKQNNIEKVKTILKDIVSSTSTFKYKEVKKLLKKLSFFPK